LSILEMAKCGPALSLSKVYFLLDIFLKLSRRQASTSPY
jgi:hypothetical protein